MRLGTLLKTLCNMRTTVSVDPDVERALQAAMQERGISFKQALNNAVGAGLMRENARRKRSFVQKTYSLGAEQHFRWDKALAAAEAIEEQARKPQRMLAVLSDGLTETKDLCSACRKDPCGFSRAASSPARR
jgi:hypothetical protein